MKWKAPLADGGSPILGYKVELAKDSGPWTLAYDGSADSHTRQFKFEGLSQGAKYDFRVISRNAIGDSLSPSDALSVYAATYPYTMDKVKRGVVSVESDNSAASIEVTWVDNPHTGGSAVLGYHLQHNNGYDSSFIEPGVNILYGTNTYTLTGLIPGATYSFRIVAYNLL